MTVDPGWAATGDACGTIYTIGVGAIPAELAEALKEHEEPTRSLMALAVEAVATFPLAACEGDAGHLERGEPHTLTISWFDPVAEPDCKACSDTGQVAGEPCPENCARAQALAGVELMPGTPGGVAPAQPGPQAGIWLGDDGDDTDED